MGNLRGFDLFDVLLVLVILVPLVVVAVLGFRTNPQEERAVDPALASANRRILARCVDVIVLGFLGWIALVILWTLVAGPISNELTDNQAFNTMVGYFGMMLLDAPCTKLWGRTPGKVLLRLRVVPTDGSSITWSRAWQRALMVWARGLGLGIPFLLLITSAVAMQRVVRSGRASWDEATHTNVIRLRAT